MKAHYEFDNDPIKIMCFEHKRRRLIVELRYQNCVKLCFSHIIVIFYIWNIFCYSFYIFEHAHFHLFFIVICIHLRCYIISDVHPIMCALCDKKWLKDLVDKKRKDLIFFLMIFFKFLFLIFFNNWIKIYALHHYYIAQAIG